MKKPILLIITSFLVIMVNAQQVISLYADSIPNSRPGKDEERHETNGATGHISLSKVSHPTLSAYFPEKDKANGMAIIICPGGGYSHLAIGHEGFDVASRLNEMGIAAFVLKYRLPSDVTMINKEVGPLQDAQRAVQLVRQRAGSWGIDPGRVGIMGFSAGGHLASTAGTHFTKAVIPNKENISLRPDFLILLYPVISFTDSLAHKGSRDNLIGPNPSEDKIREYSNEKQVTAYTPPAFIVQAGDDHTVRVQNSIAFYQALAQHGVPAELHIYPKGGHGFGLHNPSTKDEWIDLLRNWLDANGWMKK
ncbi:MAG: alpha/beta hydrolase [Bacteroidota bacterium]|nr:alpha/beta hydrolase [Bacteroidota bacterium]MDP4216974.1 alpha/beta hydrolase [Bacteroidota bacterium]MDP4244312.1 alpha/beta hydrolase [Bacteroidota bacterium]MDP4255000.1 alpha/beta hydrolase [Bacteroidota bacterium]